MYFQLILLKIYTIFTLILFSSALLNCLSFKIPELNKFVIFNLKKKTSIQFIFSNVANNKFYNQLKITIIR